MIILNKLRVLTCSADLAFTPLQRAKLHMKLSPLLFASWTTAFVVCLCLVSSLYSGEPSHPQFPSSGKENQPPENKRDNDKEKPSILQRGSESVPLVVRIANSAIEPANAANNDTAETKIKPAEKWVIWLTAGLILVGLVQAIIYAAQWKMMRETTQRSLRAYIGITTSSATEKGFLDDEGWTYWIKNYGQTPAYQVQTFATFSLVPGKNAIWPENQQFIIPEGLVGSIATIHQGHEIRTKQLLTPPRGIPFKAIKEHAMAESHTLFLYGVVKYIDTFKQRHFTKFCFRFKPGEKPMVEVCEKHNEAN